MAVTSALVDNAGYVGSAGATSTITGVQFGPAFAGRVIVVPVNSDAARTITGATIGGVTAVFTGSGAAGYLLSAVVPSGTSGNITATFSGGSDVLNAGAVVALSGASSATPSANITNGAGGSGTINVGAGGSVVATSVAGSSGSWTGVTQLRLDTTTIGIPWSTASFDNSGGALTARSVSYSTGAIMVAAAFDASGGGGAATSLPIFSRPFRVITRKR